MSPKLTPLQSRFLASIVALALLALIYWTLSSPQFAYAAEFEIHGEEDHNWHRIQDYDEGEEGGLKTRQQQEVATIEGNNIGNLKNLRAGETLVWRYPREVLMGDHADLGPGLPGDGEEGGAGKMRHKELRRRNVEEDELEVRQAGGGQSRMIYISINTCLQPSYSGSGTQDAPPPQLTLYVATENSNRNPGPNGDRSAQRAIPLDAGFANATVRARGDWYMSVHAPELSNNFTGIWNYELAVSIDDYFHAAAKEPNLFLVDSDSAAALLVTNNLTQADPSQDSYQEWMALTAPYIVFASNTNDTRTMGLENSFCGLDQNSQIVGSSDDPSGDSNSVQMSMTTRGLGNKPKEQFYVSALNASSAYHARLALVGNSTASGAGVVGGGGKVYRPVPFRTKTDGNCALLYDLDFCTEVAYAVPSTPSLTATYAQFQHLYDNYTATYYAHFNYSLAQIPCNTINDAQYSLSRTCADCARAYKEWLCAVSIPRCEDFSSPHPYLQPRNLGQPFHTNSSLLPASYLHTPYVPMSNAPTLEGSPAYAQTLLSSYATNSSRNPMIDEAIAPGPYKEVLPCEDLCFSLVQSCPAALGFGCPFPGRGLEAGYGTRVGNGNGTLTCSFLGAYVYTGGGVGGKVVGVGVWVGVVGVVWVVMG